MGHKNVVLAIPKLIGHNTAHPGLYINLFYECSFSVNTLVACNYVLELYLNQTSFSRLCSRNYWNEIIF